MSSYGCPHLSSLHEVSVILWFLRAFCAHIFMSVQDVPHGTSLQTGSCVGIISTDDPAFTDTCLQVQLKTDSHCSLKPSLLFLKSQLCHHYTRITGAVMSPNLRSSQYKWSQSDQRTNITVILILMNFHNFAKIYKKQLSYLTTPVTRNVSTVTTALYTFMHNVQRCYIQNILIHLSEDLISLSHQPLCTGPTVM